MSLPLLSTKFNIPQAGARLVHRQRLLRILDESLTENTSLTLVCGPAGYGKTTLVSEWLRTSQPLRPDQIAWLTLERSDDALTRFLTYFVSAIQHIRPGFGTGLLKLLQTHKPPPVPVLGTLLVNELSEMSESVFLVLDDYHLLTDKSIQSFMNFLVDHQPPCLHLILVTRADPALPLSRLRARGQLVEVRQEALCFLLDEVEVFANQTMDLSLTPEQLTRLAQKTEGWISGLQLATLSLRTSQDRFEFFRAFSGEHEFIADYLTDEVLASLPEQIRSFMLHTSILERLSAPLCEAVHGQGGAQATLEQLIDANLFLIPLDNQRSWYRYHNLFADLLRKRLNSTQPDIIPELHRRASRWFEQNSLPDLAIEHAIAGGDHQRAAWLIERSAERLLAYGESATLLHWLEALPEEQVLTQPGLGSLYGISLILSGRPTKLVSPLVEKMSATGNPVEYQGERNMLQALLAVYQGDAARAIQLSELAMEQLTPERPFFRTLAADTLGIGHTLAWDLPAATRAFEHVVEISRQSDNLMMTIMALNNLAGLAYVQGHLRSAISTCYEILDIARQRIGIQAPMMGKTLLNLGEMLREQGDLQAALGYLMEAARLMEAFSEVGLPLVNLAIARIYLNQHEWLSSQDYIDKARRLAQATQPVLMDDRLVEVMQVRLYLAMGNLGQAMNWARNRDFLERPTKEVFAEASRNPASYEVFQAECMALIRLLIAQMQTERALEFTTFLEELVERRKSQRRIIEVLALKALVRFQSGQLDQALQTLEKAFALAEPEGYQRIFVDEGEAMARLLYQAVSCGIRPAYTSKLLHAFTIDIPLQPAANQFPSAELVEPLSKRELEVLCLIAEGLSNDEIAQRLVISLSTVKGHTSNIFGKLGVKHRTQAVARARSLGLIPPA